ncbi:MAG: C40 family peptidase [Elusimicrobiota bacterium]
MAPERWALLRPACLVLLSLTVSACATSGLPRQRRDLGKAIAKTAEEQTGAAYRLGGSAPEKGFDCSGLTSWTHQRHGIRIPRTSRQQFKRGRKVSPRDLAPGDLLFFTTDKRGPSHVGIYLGDGRFVHAPSSGKGVRTDRLTAPYWKKRFLGARRFY